MNAYRYSFPLSPLVVTLFGTLVSVQAGDNLQAFPPAKPGMVRHVLWLQTQEDESIFKVELIAGKTVRVDTENRYFFEGKIEEKTIQGWGYTYYTVSPLGPMAGTLMAVDPNAPKKDRFVPLGGKPYLIQYNSRLPIVVYAPEGVELRYRTWTAELETRVMKEG